MFQLIDILIRITSFLESEPPFTQCLIHLDPVTKKSWSAFRLLETIPIWTHSRFSWKRIRIQPVPNEQCTAYSCGQLEPISFLYMIGLKLVFPLLGSISAHVQTCRKDANLQRVNANRIMIFLKPVPYKRDGSGTRPDRFQMDPALCKGGLRNNWLQKLNCVNQP